MSDSIYKQKYFSKMSNMRNTKNGQNHSNKKQVILNVGKRGVMLSKRCKWELKKILLNLFIKH